MRRQDTKRGGSGTRAFLAIPLPDHVVRALRGWRDRFSRALPGARFVKPGRMHITLHFFPSLTGEQTVMVSEAARRAVAAVERFELVLGGLGAFPNPRRPRVLWVGVVDGADDVSGLARRIGRLLVEAGIGVEDRPFRPHLTLARFKDPAHTDLSRVLRTSLELPGFVVEHATLFKSELLPQGPRYTELARFELRSGDVS